MNADMPPEDPVGCRKSSTLGGLEMEMCVME